MRVSLVSLIVASLSGCADVGMDSAGESSPPAARPVAVRTVVVQSKELAERTTQPATVQPWNQAAIRARANGYVAEVQVDIGSFVQAGDILAKIDAPELIAHRSVLEAQLAGLQAEIQRGRALVQVASAGVTSALADREEAKAAVQSTDAQVAAAEAEFRRVNDLVQRKAVEDRLLDETRQRRDAQLANQNAVKAAEASAAAAVEVARAELMAAEASLQVAEAKTAIATRELEEHDVYFGFTVLTAPFAGVITSRNVDPGDLISVDGGGQVASEPLFVVSQIDKVRIEAVIPEVEVSQLRIGDAVTLRFPSFPGTELSAQVSRMTQRLDTGTRTMRVEADYANEDMRLLPGMFGQATIVSQVSTTARVLPARAVRFSESGAAYVYVVDDDSRVSVVDVETGMDDGQVIQIVSGLAAGQRVVDASLRRLEDGQSVTVLSE